jgi:hypothetical protein
VKFIDETEDVEIVFIEQFFKCGKPSTKINAYDFLSILADGFDYWWIEVGGYNVIQARER